MTTKKEEIFTQLVEAHYTALYRFALSLAKSPADASDLAQQTFLIWATSGHALRDPAKAKTWLFTTLFREFLRLRRRGQRFPSLEDLTPVERDPPDRTREAAGTPDASLVMKALQEIDPAYREPLTLFYLQEQSYLEIAQILSVPIGTVMSRLYRGKRQLRSLLKSRATNPWATELGPFAACA